MTPPRTQLIRLRLTPAEKRTIERAAKAERLTVSDFVRARCGVGVRVDGEPNNQTGRE